MSQRNLNRASWRGPQLSITALVLAALLALPAAALPGEQQQRPCMDELEKFCKEVPPGEGRIIKCLQEHERELSTSCRDKVGGVVRQLEEAKQACAPDIAKHCAEVTPGGGRLIKCLAPHLEELTPACREKAGPTLERFGKMRKNAS